MGRKSTVKRQPEDVRESISLWHRNGRTLDEIVTALEEIFAVKLSRSAVHRHIKGLDRTLARLEHSRAVAEAAVGHFGREPESKVGRANMELLHAALQEFLDGEPDSETGRVLAKPMDAMLLAKAIDHLGKAARNDAELVSKIREEARKEAEKKMEKAVRGLSEKDEALTPKEVWERIKSVYRGEA
jgi:hypothetical protein